MSKAAITPYQHSEKGKKEQVEEMFDSISGNYDFLNRLITFGMDRKWRRNVLRLLLKKKPKSILDIATGTGDMPILFSKTDAERIVGVDISAGMVKVAQEKIDKLDLQNRIELSVQNSEDLQFADHSFDAVSVTYGIRNFETLTKGLAEIYRVLDRDGALIILETSQPTNRVLKGMYLFYTRTIMPLMTRLFSKDKNAYKYLSDSAINFPYGEELKAIILKIGFKEVRLYPQFFGASTIYYATK